MSVRPMPIGETEGMIQRFYDPHRGYLDQWDFGSDPSTGSRIKQEFAATMVEWKYGGGLVARLEKTLDFDVSGYGRLVLLFMPTSTDTKGVRHKDRTWTRTTARPNTSGSR